SFDSADQDFYKKKNENTEKRMENENVDQPANAPAAAPAVTQPAQVESRSQESSTLTVAREINAFGEMLGETELAREFIAGGKTVVEFRDAVKAKRGNSTPVPAKPPVELNAQ